MDELIFVIPAEQHEALVADYIAEHKAAGEPRVNGGGGLNSAKSYAGWLASIRLSAEGKPQRGRYPSSEYLCFRKDDGRLIGMANVRHALTTQKALDFDGHVGLSVRPGERRRGYASRMLQLALDECRDRHGIDRALITCNDDNHASRSTILKAGGVYEDTRQEPDGTKVQRFWINLKEKTMLTLGMTYQSTITVGPEMTAKSMKSGALDVFATPVMIAHMENTCLECVRPALEAGRSTVGTMVNVRHLAATPVGMQVRFECKLIEIDRRRMVFEVRAFDECGLIGEGTHERFDVASDAFEQKAMAKRA